MRRPLPVILAGLLLVALVATPAAGAGRGARPDSYVIPGEQVFPEGIAAGRRGEFYVSSVTTGTIYRGDASDPALEVFLPGGQDGRTIAVGLAVDRRGRLWVAGGDTGRVWVYDTRDGELVAEYDNGLGATPGATFVNDIDTSRDAAYISDSNNPQLYTVDFDRRGLGELEVLVDFTGTALEYVPGEFNVNGVEVSRDGDTLVVVQSVSGGLFRVDTGTGEVAAIDLGGATLPGGDGLLLEGDDLYVVQNFLQTLNLVELDDDLATGEVAASETNPRYRFPTTVDRVGGRLLLPNSQLDLLFGPPGSTPTLPFEVLAVDDPEIAED